MQFLQKDLGTEKLIELYRNLLLPRMIEEKMLVLLRQGKISKWFSGIGQEAIAVGATMALLDDEWVMPLHRNLGVFTSRKMPLNKLFKQWQGNQDGYSKGRERSFHFGNKEHHICGMISHLGPQLAIADGVALAYKLRKEQKVSLAFTGDGGTSEGDFHEALNTAAVWDLPVIFIIENNGYGLSTPTSEQYRCKNLVDKAAGYGIEGVQIDGNNILTVYDTIKGVREYCIKNQKPYLIECMTFRMRGHEEASGVKYVPKNLFEEWEKKDPIKNFESWLLRENLVTEAEVQAIRAEIKNHIEEELKEGFLSDPIIVDTNNEVVDVYATSQPNPAWLIDNSYEGPVHSEGISSEKKFINAISDALEQSLQKHSNLVLMGQDIAEYGGVFKITEGFVEAFGKGRVRNTPLCEAAIVGSGFGLSINGMKAMVEMQFADFVTEGFNQIVNNLAKSHYRWGQNADVVVRMPTGAAVAAGPFHSQSNEAWFFHTPGLKIAYPAFASDAKGLLLTAFEDPNPVMFFEHKALYRSITEDISDDYYTIPFGKARLVREGSDLTIVTYGLGVHWAMEILDNHPEIKADLIDLRTLVPLDRETIINSVLKTGKAIVLHEDTLTGGIGGELSSIINENCFQNLDAPVVRVGSLDTPVPMNADLEWNFLPKARFEQALMDLFKY